MCGRFALTSNPELLAQLFGLMALPRLGPRYNIAPTQLAPVIRAKNGGRELDLLSWGLVPHWARDRTIATRMINARSETAREKPAFREALESRRCIVPADGFYEWKREGRGKQPYLVRRRDGQPYAMAGLWETWRGPKDAPLAEPLVSFTVLTTEPSSRLRELHDRQPVILEASMYDAWLDPKQHDPVDLAEMMAPRETPDLEVVRVSRRVNNVAHDDAACWEAEEEPEPPKEEPTLWD